MTPITVFPSAARTATFSGKEIFNDGHHLGVKLYLDITASGGTTPTLDLKLQSFDRLSQKWFDIPGAAFAQKTTTGQSTLTVYPGLTETVNEAISDVTPDIWRAVATIGGTSPTFTFSLGGCLLTGGQP